MENLYNINFSNPFYDTNRSDIKNLDKFKDGSKEQQEWLIKRNTTRNAIKIVDGDLQMIRESNGLIAILDSSSAFIGTPMEIFFAQYCRKMPVYVITDKFAYHPWIKRFATRIFKNKSEFQLFTLKKYGQRRI